MPSKLKPMNKMGVIFLTYRRQLQKELTPHEITLKQHYLLKQLTRKDFLYPSEIADILFCDRPTATVVLNNMEKQHWIQREKDLENGKQIKIILTQEGRDKFNAVDKALQTSPNSTYDPLACLTDEEKFQLDRLLNKVWHHIQSHP